MDDIATKVRKSDYYNIIKDAIGFIEKNADRQPNLAEIAAVSGLSEAHFQRIFSKWTGVSPKKYLGYLTVNYAKELLRSRHTVLDVALEVGLSGPSRLHDLCLTWEAMTPGTYASGGDGLAIDFGWFDSPFGDVVAFGTAHGLCGLGFASACGRQATYDDLANRWPKATFSQSPNKIEPWVMAAFTGGGKTQLALIGAPFQIKVWEALLQIPSGYVTTYADIARKIDRPKAVRAVGAAVGRNPISWLIPCHRALRKSGELGGYHWGQGVKRAMLAYESARLEALNN